MATIKLKECNFRNDDHDENDKMTLANNYDEDGDCLLID